MNRLFAMDELNKTLLTVGIVSFLLRFLFTNVAWANYLCTAIAVAALIFFAIRLLYSNNREKRERENRFFASAFASVKNFFTGKTRGGNKRAKVVTPNKSKPSFSQRWHEFRNYRYLVCPQCQQKLRVPRGKGKIKVTCTKCRNQFIAKS